MQTFSNKDLNIHFSFFSKVFITQKKIAKLKKVFNRALKIFCNVIVCFLLNDQILDNAPQAL